LNEALVSGHIKVEIIDKERKIEELSDRMRAHFNLLQATVIGSPSANLDYLKKSLGRAACKTLYESVRPGDIIGMGPGGTMLELVESLDPERPFPGITLVPLMGGWGYGGVAYEVNKLLGNAAGTMHCDFHLMPCPALVSTQELRETLFREPLIADIVKLWDSVDAAIFSIGGEVESGNYPQLRGNEALVSVAKKEGAVGDILGRFIAPDGGALDIEVNRRIISIPSESLKRVPLRIGIGGGSSKIRAVHAALRGELINVLISDEGTCETILAMEDEQHD
jgi:deoxyribonucleoside regulator